MRNFIGGALALLLVATAAHGDTALTARNKQIVRDFYTAVFVGRNVDVAPKFMRPDYIQHNTHIPTGRKGFMDAFRKGFARKFPDDYKREILKIVGEDDMVVLYDRQTWTSPKDRQHHEALGFEMFRVQDGMIAEHWDADD